MFLWVRSTRDEPAQIGPQREHCSGDTILNQKLLRGLGNVTRRARRCETEHRRTGTGPTRTGSARREQSVE
jgi:hypothetical protein